MSKAPRLPRLPNRKHRGDVMGERKSYKGERVYLCSVCLDTITLKFLNSNF